MISESPPNPFFRPPRESTLGDDEVRSHVRAEFHDIRSRFLDRLACACVFDRERFEALLLWLDTLRRCYVAANLPMAASDFDKFSEIADYLEQEAAYSRDQRAECAAALSQWLGIMRQFHLLPEETK
ncbi:MAG: hypothetical protein B7Z37_17690 [Verrucomicrobia bacterium 12-59-8]|nr:MAG: hypothetical protein B7Z37_17690 [Verrucomicrobia bacterium 12-59-8]